MRMHLKKKSKHFKVFRVIIILIIIFSIFSGLFKLTSYAGSFYLSYSEELVINKISTIINDSMTDELFESLDTNDIYYVTKNSKDEIEMIDYNSYFVNVFLQSVTNVIQRQIEIFDKQDTFLEIPLFSLFNNPLISNYGPKIPVKVKSFGQIDTNIVTSIKEYGINNSLIEMSINVVIKESIILPVFTKNIKVEANIPISYKIIRGSIPNYYSQSGLNKNSSIFSIPLEDS